VDELIEARERRTVAEIFGRHGDRISGHWSARSCSCFLPSATSSGDGRGTFVDPDNRAAMNRDGLSIWLDVPFEDVLARLPADGRRLLAADRAQMERLFATRRLAYAAHLRVDARARHAEAVVERIMTAS
jgi:shikimate kinase